MGRCGGPPAPVLNEVAPGFGWLTLAGAFMTDPEQIYQHYPRKVGKIAALKAIEKAIKLLADREDDPVAFLIEKVKVYAASPDGHKSRGKFRPHPSTWFNQGRYDDDVAEWQEDQTTDGMTPCDAFASTFNKPITPQEGWELMGNIGPCPVGPPSERKVVSDE